MREKPGCKKPIRHLFCITQLKNAQDMSSWLAPIFLIMCALGLLASESIEKCNRETHILSVETWHFLGVRSSSYERALSWECLCTYGCSNIHTIRCQHKGIRAALHFSWHITSSQVHISAPSVWSLAHRSILRTLPPLGLCESHMAFSLQNEIYSLPRCPKIEHTLFSIGSFPS